MYTYIYKRDQNDIARPPGGVFDLLSIRQVAMSERKAVIKNADMNTDMQEDAVHTAAAGTEKYQVEKDIAAYIKKEFDRKYGSTWHCIVGKHFGR